MHIKKLLLLLLLFSSCLVNVYSQSKASHDEINSLEVPIVTLDNNTATKVFNYFKNSDLFIWGDGNNCEDRANAVSLILDSWEIPNFKAWIFTGNFLGKGGGELMTVKDPQNEGKSITWKFHVATVIPYKHDNKIHFAVIDPATLKALDLDGKSRDFLVTDNINIDNWAETVTVQGQSYYFLTTNKNYMWNEKGRDLNKATFNRVDSTNFEWTIQGLAGYNGLNNKHERFIKSEAGKIKMRETQEKLERLKATKPNFIR